MSNTASNATSVGFWENDNLTGDFMACSSGDGRLFHDGNYSLVCSYVQFITGPLLLFSGAWLIYLAFKQLRPVHYRGTFVASFFATTVTLGHRGSKVTNFASIASRRRKKETEHRENQKDNSWHGVQLSLVIGLGASFCGLLLLVFVGGTKYPASNPLSLLSDFFCGASISASVYLGLLQNRGAEYFESLVLLPGRGRAKRRQNFGLKASQVYCKAMNALEGPLNIPIFLSLWILLCADVLSRPVYLLCLYILHLASGIRAIHAIILKRAATIAKVSQLQRRVQDSQAARERRQATLRTKTHSLLFDIGGVIFGKLAVAVSFFVGLSFFSSRRYIVATAVAATIGGVNILLVAVVVHIRMRNARKRASNAENPR